MSGVNPYIQQPDFQLPQQRYKVTFQPSGETVEVDPDKLPYAHDGLPGSLLSVALEAGLDMDHSCGGVCACSTCHVRVVAGMDSCNEATEDEEDMLDMAPGLQANSRLACQCVPNGSSEIVVEIPDWNRNLVSEGH
jgi:2Fe-2S ferredoxin